MAKPGTVRRAEEIEADADQYPEERGEILLEAANAWKLAGHRDRARRIVDGLVADGGEDGRWARSERIELLVDDGDWTSAWEDIAVLAHEPDLDVLHCETVAELLVEKGELEQGLAWFDRGVARLGEQEWAELRGPDAGSSLLMALLAQRGAVRERLGLPPDVADTLVVPHPGLPSEPAVHHEAAPVVSKPPGRNEPCSCGSGTKYKKCCGRPG